MTGEEVLALAASYGIRVTLALGDLCLEADHEPPAEALVALRDHKEAVVAELGRIAAMAGEWCQIFEDHVATVMRVRGLPRPEAERATFWIVLVEFLNATHPDTDPNCCAWCGKAGEALLPFGWGTRHSWLHSPCHAPWLKQRRAKAEQDLASMGIVRPPAGDGLRPPRKPEIVAVRAEPRRLDNRTRARIIDWDRGFCLGCRGRILPGQPWIDVVNDEATATARFHRDCLDEWIASHQAATAKGTNS